MLVCIAADAFLYLAVRGMAQRSALKAKNDLLSAQIDRQKELRRKESDAKTADDHAK